MDKKQLHAWAIKGIDAEIDKLEKKIKKGRQYLEDIDNGKEVKTPKTRSEIVAIVEEKQKEIESLQEIRNKL